MKKRISFLTLTLVFIFTLSSCTSMTAYEQYNKAVESMSADESISMDMVMDISLTYLGTSMGLDMSGLVKQVRSSDTDIDMEMDMSIQMLGISQNVHAYYQDGYYYMEIYGQKIKYEMSIEDALSQTGAQPVQFSEDSIYEQTTEKKDGGTQLTFTVDGAAMSDMLSDQLSSLGAMGTEDMDIDMDFGDLTINALVDKNNNFISMTMDVNVTAGVEGETMEIGLFIELNNIQYGGVTIDFPEDLDSYVLTDEQSVF